MEVCSPISLASKAGPHWIELKLMDYSLDRDSVHSHLRMNRQALLQSTPRTCETRGRREPLGQGIAAVDTSDLILSPGPQMPG